MFWDFFKGLFGYPPTPKPVEFVPEPRAPFKPPAPYKPREKTKTSEVAAPSPTSTAPLIEDATPDLDFPFASRPKAGETDACGSEPRYPGVTPSTPSHSHTTDTGAGTHPKHSHTHDTEPSYKGHNCPTPPYVPDTPPSRSWGSSHSHDTGSSHPGSSHSHDTGSSHSHDSHSHDTGTHHDSSSHDSGSADCCHSGSDD